MSRRRLILRRQVPADLLDIHDHIAKDNIKVAVRFLNNVRGTPDRLVQVPGMGSLKSFRLKLREVRSWPVEGFPNHLVYYRFTPNALIVPAVIHGSGDVSRILRRRRP